MRSKASVTIGNGTHGVLPKAPTGIPGLDEITLGGLPRERATLICGSAGGGITLFAMEFLARGAMQYDEPGNLFARSSGWRADFSAPVPCRQKSPGS